MKKGSVSVKLAPRFNLVLALELNQQLTQKDIMFNLNNAELEAIPPELRIHDWRRISVLLLGCGRCLFSRSALKRGILRKVYLGKLQQNR